MESLSQLLRRTIRQGAPLYNNGDKEGCYKAYLEAAQDALNSPMVASSTPEGPILQTSVKQAQETAKTADFSQAAWILRRAFDEILSTSKVSKKLSLDTTTDKEHDSSSDDEFYWQDETVEKSSDQEKGEALAHVGLILQSKVKAGTHTRNNFAYENCMVATALVEELTSMSLATSRTAAVGKLSQLVQAGFLLPLTMSITTIFEDGTQHLYRFATREQLEESLKDMQAKPEAFLLGTTESLLVKTLALLVDSSKEAGRPELKKDLSRRVGRRVGQSMAPQELQGAKIADSLSLLIPLLDIKERRYNLKKYPDCFIGKDAVSTMLERSLAPSRTAAVEQLDVMLQAGLIHHVTRDHAFEDKMLFYKVTPVGEIKAHLDALKAAGETSDKAQIQIAALSVRYGQFAGLDVPDILNAFFKCDTPEGWDLVDLQNWRNNMKRWGFGRREDQDDDMVDRLSPLLLSVDPKTWDVSGDEKWESPHGILAQIAIFDQVSRSAFRGTPDAFAWDQLAIRATKVALSKGYFDTAYKSTLNQFLLLLPLEHSEDWEDQKLAVSLVLKLLSNVAIQDVGYSDYEIVKRLEFSKRLSVGFLEHAQVIAKFKRYPHRNRPLGRSTTLEERVWLASDLVPRWAQSQNPEDARTILQLPVIPLKRLTRRR
jgi:uncharacterized protein (DUF924 family)